MIIRKAVFICSFAILIIFSSISAKADALQILTCEEPPMNYMEDNQITGFTTDIVKEIALRTKTYSEIQLLPWKRVYRTGLEMSNVVLFTAAKTSERENLFHWVGPVVEKRWILYSKKSEGLRFNVIDEVKKVNKIAVMRDDARHHFLINNGFEDIFVTEDHLNGLKMLLENRVNLWVSSDFEAFLIAKKAGLDPNQIEDSFVMKTIRSYILISKGTPTEMVELWQRTFNELKSDGTLHRIAAKWAKKLDIPLVLRNGILTINQ